MYVHVRSSLAIASACVAAVASSAYTTCSMAGRNPCGFVPIVPPKTEDGIPIGFRRRTLCGTLNRYPPELTASFPIKLTSLPSLTPTIKPLDPTTGPLRIELFPDSVSCWFVDVLFNLR